MGLQRRGGVGGCHEALLEGGGHSGVVGWVGDCAAVADDGWLEGVGRRGSLVAAVVEKLWVGLIEKRVVGSGSGDAGVVGGCGGTAFAAVVGRIGTPALLVLRGWSRRQSMFRLDELVAGWSFGRLSYAS